MIRTGFWGVIIVYFYRDPKPQGNTASNSSEYCLKPETLSGPNPKP